MKTTDLIRKLREHDSISNEEETAVEGLVSDVVRCKRGATIVREGEHQDSSRLLLEGWVARYTVLADGSRQITQFHVAGDFIDLHSFTLKRLDHSIGALTACRIGIVPHDRLKLITETCPHLTRMLWLGTMVDAATYREWLTAVGRLPAKERVARLFCELYIRLESIGQARDHVFAMPITQEEIGDACGLTSVHVNRVMQSLRRDGLIETKHKTVRILDWDRIRKFSQFDPIYLNLWCEPR